MSARWIVRSAFCLLAFLHWSPSEVQAKAAIITHGDHITPLGTAKNAPPGMQLPSNQVGYIYGYFGVFWIDFWTSGGEYCLYRDMTYWPISREEAAALMGVSVSEVNQPFWYRFPLGWMILLGGLALIVLGALMAPKAPPANPLLSDPRYLEAEQIVSTQFDQEMQRQMNDNPEVQNLTDEQRNEWATAIHRSAFDAGLKHLINLGIDPAEAEQNLTTLLSLRSNQ